MAKHFQRVMDYTGDTRHEFDPANSAEVKEAMERFEKLTKAERYIAAEKTGPGTQKLVRAFDPNAEETVFHRPLAGG